MEAENRVSIWLGKFNSEEDLDAFMQEQYTEDGDVFSDFMKAFDISFVDNQFQEVLFSERLSQQDLNTLSYSNSFVHKIKSDLEKYNSLIAIYNFDYSGKIVDTERIVFFGVFDYK